MVLAGVRVSARFLGAAVLGASGVVVSDLGLLESAGFS